MEGNRPGFQKPLAPQQGNGRFPGLWNLGQAWETPGHRLYILEPKKGTHSGFWSVGDSKRGARGAGVYGGGDGAVDPMEG